MTGSIGSPKPKQLWQMLLSIVVILPLLFYTQAQWQRPALSSQSPTAIFSGITYERQVNRNRPQVIHIVDIDLTQAGIDVFVSPGSSELASDREIKALTTSDFLTQYGLQLAVNAHFFYPFEEETPWRFTPHPGDLANVLGIAVSSGRMYSPPQESWPALCFGADGRAQLQPGGTCPPATRHAIAGNQALILAGESMPLEENDRSYGRVMVALNQPGDRLWLVVVDGKQPYYSEGATLAQLIEIAQGLGADAALNLDGGGSTTLVMAADRGAKVLNAPIHTKWPMRERPVASHLGFRAVPI